VITINYSIVFNKYDLLESVEENINLEIEILDFLSISKILKKIIAENPYSVTIVTGKNYENIEFLNRLESLVGFNLMAKSYLKEKIYNISREKNILFFSGKYQERTGNIRWGKIYLIKPFPYVKKKRFFWF
jgi:hypothetical protein